MGKIVDAVRKRYYLLTSLLMFLSFPSFDVPLLKGFPFFAWIALAPLFISMRKCEPKEAFRRAFTAGIFGHLLTFHWIGNFGVEVPGGPVVILLFLVPSLTAFFAVKVFVAEYLSRRYEGLRLLIFPSVWIVIEWVQSIGFLAFPMTYWGYSQYPFTPFIQMASITGIYGISFILILSNAVLADVALARIEGVRPLKALLLSVRGRRFLLFLLFIALVCAYGAASMTARGGGERAAMRVSVVQSCIDPWKVWGSNKYGYLEELKQLTDDSLRHNPDLLIWSESATLEPITYHWKYGSLNPFEQDVIDSVRRWGRPLLTGEIGVVERLHGNYVERLPQNNALLISAEGVPLTTYAKINLVPFGEWFPYERIVPFLRGLLDSFGASRFVPGRNPVLFSDLGRPFGVLICYEGIFHRLCRTYRNMGAQFFVNITNDGWTRAYNGHMQHFAASVFRAVENGVWYVRAGNTGYTAVIDPMGRRVASLPIWEKRYLIADLDFSMNRRTVYSAAGDVILYLAMALVLASALAAVVQKIRGGDEKA